VNAVASSVPLSIEDRLDQGVVGPINLTEVLGRKPGQAAQFTPENLKHTDEEFLTASQIAEKRQLNAIPIEDDDDEPEAAEDDFLPDGGRVAAGMPGAAAGAHHHFRRFRKPRRRPEDERKPRNEGEGRGEKSGDDKPAEGKKPGEETRGDKAPTDDMRMDKPEPRPGEKPAADALKVELPRGNNAEVGEIAVEGRNIARAGAAVARIGSTIREAGTIGRAALGVGRLLVVATAAVAGGALALGASFALGTAGAIIGIAAVGGLAVAGIVRVATGSNQKAGKFGLKAAYDLALPPEARNDFSNGHILKGLDRVFCVSDTIGLVKDAGIGLYHGARALISDPYGAMRKVSDTFKMAGKIGSFLWGAVTRKNIAAAVVQTASDGLTGESTGGAKNLLTAVQDNAKKDTGFRAQAVQIAEDLGGNDVGAFSAVPGREHLHELANLFLPKPEPSVSRRPGQNDYSQLAGIFGAPHAPTPVAATVADPRLQNDT